MEKIILGVSVFVLLALSTVSFAQTNNTEPVSCFDYYKFGSVYASLETKNYKNSSGTIAKFFGEIKNDNAYPIVDGKLFVKVMRANDSYEKTGGQDEVDSFIVKEGISIPANSSIPVDFTWQIPGYAISGEYQISTYFLVDNSFNMSGLPFTTDIVGGTVKFEVVGEQKKGLIFDRTKIMLNDNVYYTVAFPPILSATNTANISLALTNSTNQTQRVPVTLELYEWDGQAQKNLIDTKHATYLIDANKSITIPYTVTDTKHSVYYLLAKAQYKDAKSEVSVRFGREGIQEPRINFSTFTNYPFKKGEENSLVTCVHNTSNSDAEYGKVVTTVLDHAGNKIYSSTYEGKITGALQGLLSKFTPNANYKDLKIETKIYDKDNNVIDETSVDYVCSALSNDCKEPNTFFNFNTLIMTIIGTVLMLLIVIFRHLLKKKDLIVMFTFMVLVVSMFVPNVSRADSIDWTGVSNQLFTKWSDYYAYDYSWEIIQPTGWILSNVLMSVDYHTKVYKNGTTELVNKNDTVQSGQKLDFLFGPFHWNDIVWNSSGGSWGTPFGDWVQNAEMTMDNQYNDYVGGINVIQEYGIYPDYTNFNNALKDFYLKFNLYGPYLAMIDSDTSIDNYYYSESSLLASWFNTRMVFGQFSVNPPVTNLTFSNNDLECENYEKITGNDSFSIKITCTVKPTQISKTITPNFVFGKTFGKLYATYSDSTEADSTCIQYNSKGKCIKWNMTNYKLCPELSESKLKNDPYFIQSTRASGNRNYCEAYDQSYRTFVADIATTTIPYALNVQPSVSCTPLNTPAKPTITGISSGVINTSYPFSFTPNNATTTYQIDWGAGAEWETTANPINKTWTAPGTKSIKVKATDTTSLCSIESDVKTIDITENNLGEIKDLSATGLCGSVSLSWSGNGADSYQVFRKASTESTFALLGSVLSAGYTNSTNIVNDTTYTYKIIAMKSGYSDLESNTSSATPSCPTCDPNTKPNKTPDAPPLNCYSAVSCNLSATPPVWQQNPYTCPSTPIDSKFYFDPNTVDVNGSCPLFLTISGVTSCELRNRLLQTSSGPFSANIITKVIDIKGLLDSAPIGTHTLWCKTPDSPGTFLKQDIAPKSCYSDSNIKEN